MDGNQGNARGFDRRTLAKGALWTAPVIAVGAASPAYAVSYRKDPGINGWVLNTPSRYSFTCDWTLEVNSNVGGTGSDGAPFGLYLYDIQSSATISNASLTYWVLGDHTSSPYRISWTTYWDHSSCWSGPSTGSPQRKADGMIYTPYTWTYSCPILASQVSSDGRLYLGEFHVKASLTQPDNYCYKLNYWTQRTVTVDPDGSGPQAAQRLTFERRNGTDGPY